MENPIKCQAIMCSLHLNIWFGQNKVLDCVLMCITYYTYCAVLENKLPTRYFMQLKQTPSTRNVVKLSL